MSPTELTPEQLARGAKLSHDAAIANEGGKHPFGEDPEGEPCEFYDGWFQSALLKLSFPGMTKAEAFRRYTAEVERLHRPQIEGGKQ